MTDAHMFELLLALGSGFVVLVLAHWKEHRDLHARIDEVHHSLRDRLDQVWKHMNK